MIGTGLAVPQLAMAQVVDGSTYAGQAQLQVAQGVHTNALLTDMSECEVALLCEARQKVTWIGTLDYVDGGQDGDFLSAPYGYDRITGMVGAQFALSDEAFAGIALGYANRNLDFEDTVSDSFDLSGPTIGAYIGFDDGVGPYAKAVGSYSWWGGDAERATTSGDVDMTQWTLGAHVGYHWAFSDTASATPYIHVDHSSLSFDGLSEDGATSDALVFVDKDEARTYSTIGAKFGADINWVIAEIDLGWRHMFGPQRARLDTDCVGCPSSLYSNWEERDSALIGLSFGGMVGNADVKLGYQALFNGAREEHSGGIRIRFPFGERPVSVIVPPSPPADLPPPPPPAPATITCPDGTVILATDPCPPPPPPPAPPPPMPEPERG
ncbi:autotransporter outer membrane beta-barrel domain-containing protein [Sphingomicrobium astaxanthinifaciens]|nr:autotransporter outer membrane beta-barrel domain-containing protein [Sphingomicrobium astaxanthinifaciens]